MMLLALRPKFRKLRFQMIDDILLTTKELSAISLLQMQDLLHYMFKNAPRQRCVEVAEIAFRHRSQVAGLDLFLAAVLPLAERAARRRAGRALHRLRLFHGWRFPLDGARVAAASTRSSTALGTGSPLNARTARRVSTASYTSMSDARHCSRRR